jgi:HAMP domain-containing protein
VSDQNYGNHTRLLPPFHFVLLPALLAGVIGSFVNLRHSLGDSQRLYSASLLVLVTVALLLVALFARMFALKAQDRAIRAEENLRHFVATGKLLDPKLTIRQIIGLRFASDAEFGALAQKAAASGLSEKEIKKAITNWKADHDRV